MTRALLAPLLILGKFPVSAAMRQWQGLRMKRVHALLFLLLPAMLGCSVTSSPTRPSYEEERNPYGAPDLADEYARLKRLGERTDLNPRQLYEQAEDALQSMRTYSVMLDQERPSLAKRAFALEADALETAAERNLARWSWLGPGNIGGRTRTLVIDPQQTQTMYTGGVSGGVWKTTNGGAAWRPTGDTLANIAINSLAMDPRDNNKLYAGTGEGYFREIVRGTGLPLRGGGIFVSTDAGESWSILESTRTSDFHFVNDLFVSSVDTNRIYAATRTGVFRSSDAGQSWSRILSVDASGGCLDLAARPGSTSDYLYVSCGTLAQATVYRNTDAAAEGAWNAVLSEPNMGRTSLAVAPSNPDVVYALSASNAPGNASYQALLGLFRSNEAGAAGTWKPVVQNTATDRLSTLLLTNPIAAAEVECKFSNQNKFVTMGWYCNTIAVDPTNPERVWAGGVDLFRSDDGGANWGPASYWWANRTTPSYVHADQHAIVFHPGFNGTTNNTLFASNDGGIFKTDEASDEVLRGITTLCNPNNGKIAWQHISGNLGITQFYHGAVFPNGREYIAGAQDNGTLRGRDESGANGWTPIAGGDGSYLAINPVKPSTFYVSSQVANILRTEDGGSTFKNATAGLSDQFLFITPLMIDRDTPQILWTGGRKLWRTDNEGVSWTAASTTLGAGRVSAIAVSGPRVLAGTSDGFIYRNDEARSATPTTAWPGVQLREGFISSITQHPYYPDVVYATFAGFGGKHVWKSTDAGVSWAPLDGEGDGQIPDIPVHSLVVDPQRPQRLFIGTDLGVMVSIDGGAHWMTEVDGMPNAVTEWLVIAASSEGRALYAFTHGRGVWRATLTDTPTPRRRTVRSGR
jgi:photosystem II stability/assembly factor-like uncharacterized protein